MAQREFEQGAALGYPEAQYNLANMLLRQGRTDANVERARQLLTSALNAGYVDASASLRALPSKASPMPWSTRGWSVPATGTAVPTPEQRATPAPAPVAQTSPPMANPVLAKVFVPKMLDIQVPYLETIVGPAMRLTKLQHDLELRTYQVGDCELLAYSKGGTVSAYGLRLKAGCAADLSQFIQQPVSVTADATFGGLADTLGGGNGTYQSACIYGCGNATDSRVEWTWEGSNAQNQIKVQLAVTLVAQDSLNAMLAWQNSMFQSESHEYVASARFNCDGKYQQAASSAFQSVRVTELFVGHGESMDDQDVAIACAPSGGTPIVGAAGASAPPPANTASSDKAAPPATDIAPAPTALRATVDAQIPPPRSTAAINPEPSVVPQRPSRNDDRSFLVIWFWRLAGFTALVIPLFGAAMAYAAVTSKDETRSNKIGVAAFGIGVFGLGCFLVDYCWSGATPNRGAPTTNATALAEGSATDAGAPSESQTPEPASANPHPMPPEERDFIATIARFHSAYSDASTEFKQGVVYRNRGSELAKVFANGYDISNWTGTIYKLSSNGDGFGIIEVTLSGDAWLTTWNNSLSDIEDHTLISPNSTLYSKLGDLKEGDEVTFSGRFISTSDADFLKNTDLSMNSKMTQPEFLFVFSAISKN
jgi:hypothetical protein